MDPVQIVGEIPDEFFLKIYAALIGLAVVVTCCALYWAQRSVHEPEDAKKADLDGYALAFLAGGSKRVIEAIHAKLVIQGVMCVKDSALVRSGCENNARAQPDWMTVVAPWPKSEVDQIFVAINAQLLGAGYFVPNARALILFSLMLISWGSAASWLGLGMAHDNEIYGTYFPYPPTFFYFVLNMMVVVYSLLGVAVLAGAAVGWTDPPPGWFLSQRGRHTLAEARKRYAALHPAVAGPAPQLSSQEVVLSVGLFGLEVWKQGPLAVLNSTLNPSPDPSPTC